MKLSYSENTIQFRDADCGNLASVRADIYCEEDMGTFRLIGCDGVVTTQTAAGWLQEGNLCWIVNLGGSGAIASNLEWAVAAIRLYRQSEIERNSDVEGNEIL